MSFKEIVGLVLAIFIFCLPFILICLFIYGFILTIYNYNPIYSYIDIYGDEQIVDYCGTRFGTFYCEDNGKMFYVDNYKIEE